VARLARRRLLLVPQRLPHLPRQQHLPPPRLRDGKHAEGKDRAMARIARMLAVGVLLLASLGSTGCLHTLAETYHDYPPEAWDPPYTQHQGNPRDG
jgi:hypothetical protein